MSIKYMLGCNYWGADHGTDMWRHYDPVRIREEMKQLSEYGVRCMRVFPNWREFQPIEMHYAWRGLPGEYASSLTEMPVLDDGVSQEQLDNFRDFANAAKEYGISLVVAIVTGWMSGRLFTPPALTGKNLINDPEALMWMRRYIHRFVRELKDCDNIIMWDLGNECNCLGEAKNRADAYNWTATVADAIRCEDNTRPIASGMHGLSAESGGIWNIADQGELTDMLTPHPYPSPTVGGDVEPYTRLRMTFLPTAQCIFYSGLSGKGAMIQESGTFSQSIGSNAMSGDFMRIQILSSLTHNMGGYFWWCAWEQNHLMKSPYAWSMIERELGLFDKDRQPKPVAYTMQAMSKMLDALPDPFPKRLTDGICLLTREQNQQNTAFGSLILAKQAGIELECAYCDGILPESDLYIMPAITGWQVSFRRTWDLLLSRVEKGATLFISYAGGQLTDFPTVVGAESRGFLAGQSHKVKTARGEIGYYAKEILMTPTTAEVVLENEAGNPVLTKNPYGDGYIYFLNMPVEHIAHNQPDGYNKAPYYVFYEQLLDHIKPKAARSTDRNIGVTVHPESDDVAIVSILNYSDHEIEGGYIIEDGWQISELLYGKLDTLNACDGAIIRIKKN